MAYKEFTRHLEYHHTVYKVKLSLASNLHGNMVFQINTIK
jgi:hypothetical protein